MAHLLDLATTAFGPRPASEKAVISGIRVSGEESKGFLVNRLQDGVLVAGFLSTPVGPFPVSPY